MQKLYEIIHYYFIATFLFSASVFSFEISFCDGTPFPELCNSILGPIFESHESHSKVSMSQAPEAPMARYTLDARAMTAWTDCLDLYNHFMHHLNLSMSPTDFENLLTTSLVNHQACQNGFKDSHLSLLLKNLLQNVSKSFEELLSENKPSASDFSMEGGHGLIKLAEGGISQANLVVAQDGSGDFKSVTEAIKALETRRTGTERFVIHVKSGVYKENFVIEQWMPNLTLIGDGIDATLITNYENTTEGYVTFIGSTAQIWGSGFLAIGITFENTAGPETKGIALLSASDLSAFYKCSFKGYQNTLVPLKLRQFYRECNIYGTIDFIVGDAAAVFQKCNIYVRNPSSGQQNTITAQERTDPSSTTGFVIHNSSVTAAPDLNPTQGTFLGRPWENYSRVVFIKCYLDSLIDPLGWMPYKGDSAFDKLYYAEYLNTGKGAYTGGRVKWPGYHDSMTSEEVQQFSVEKFIAGESWIPFTGVPFDSSL